MLTIRNHRLASAGDALPKRRAFNHAIMVGASAMASLFATLFGFMLIAQAAEDELVVLSWSAPTEADCPDAAYVVGEIRRYVGEGAGLNRAAISANATVHGMGRGHWQLVLKTTQQETVGERVFEDESCRAVADAAVVVLSWMVDPDAMANRSRAAISAEQPKPLPPAAPPGPEKSEPRHTVPFAGLGLLGDNGTLPSAALGVEARGGVSLRPFRLAAKADYWPSRGKTSGSLMDGTAVGGTFALWATGLDGCVDALSEPSSRGFGLSLCAGPEIDVIRAAGFGVNTPGKASKGWLSLTASCEGHLPLAGALHVLLRVSAVLPSEREHFALRGVGEIYQPASFAGRATAGLELEL